MVENLRGVNIADKPVPAPRHKTSFLQWKEPSAAPPQTSQRTTTPQKEKYVTVKNRLYVLVVEGDV